MPLTSIAEQRTLVIAGAWNPAILSPNWVAKEVLQLGAAADFQVGMQVSINDPSQPVGFQFEGISFAPALNVLVFQLMPDLDHQKAIDVAAGILELLPHTPVSGVGFNFGFQVLDANTELLRTFSAGSRVPSLLEDENAALVKQGWGASIGTKGRLINMTCKLEAGVVVIGFNVHLEAPSATAAAAILRAPNLYEEIFADVKSIVEQLATEDLT